MADEFDSITLDTSGLGNPSDPQQNLASSENEIDDWQRWVMTNLMDTQPKKRANYLRRLGFEMNPKNENEYRPLGSDGNYAEIDPDPGRFLGVIPLPFNSSKGGWTEFLKDFGDFAWDTVEGGLTGLATLAAIPPSAAAGAGPGATVGSMFGPGGTAAGATISSVITGALGGIGAGASTKAAFEILKGSLADTFTDEDVPLDTHKVLYDSLLTGIFSTGLAGAGKAFNQWRRMKAEDLTKSLKEIAVRKSNGTFNQRLMDDFVKNPLQYTPEKVKEATDKLLGIQDFIFGTSVENPYTTKQISGGIAGKAIEKLNKRADIEMDKLSQLDEASFTVPELFDIVYKPLKKYDKTFNTQSELKAAKYLKKELKRIMKAARDKSQKAGVAVLDDQGRPLQGEGEEVFRKLNFKEARDLLKDWQNAAYQEGPVKGNRIMKEITANFKSAADKKAENLGSDLRVINDKRSEILKLYNRMYRSIKDGSMQNAYVGKDSFSKSKVKRVIEDMDRILNTQVGPTLERAQYRAAVQRLYDSPSAFGSGSVLADGLKQGFKEAKTGAFAGGTLGGAASFGNPYAIITGASLGGLTGMAKGTKRGISFSKPEKLVKEFSDQTDLIAKLDDNLADPETVWEAAQKTFKSPAVLGGQAAREVSQESFEPMPDEGPVLPKTSATEPRTPLQQEAEIPPNEFERDEFDDIQLDTSGL